MDNFVVVGLLGVCVCVFLFERGRKGFVGPEEGEREGHRREGGATNKYKYLYTYIYV